MICDRIFFVHAPGRTDNILAFGQEENVGPYKKINTKDLNVVYSSTITTSFRC